MVGLRIGKLGGAAGELSSSGGMSYHIRNHRRLTNQ
jgi:hypothetical protein